MVNMKKFIAFGFVIAVFISSNSCSSKSTPNPPGGGGGGGEASLVVDLNPPANSVQPAAPQTDFPLTVTINSTMLPQGVTISVNAKKDDGSGAAAFFIESRNSNAVSNSFTIANTPTSVVCITTVTVTSKTSATNTWTGTYRYSRKP